MYTTEPWLDGVRLLQGAGSDSDPEAPQTAEAVDDDDDDANWHLLADTR